MTKDRRKNSQTYLEERRREQAERRRRLDQVVRQKEKKRETLQKERQARHRAELEQYTEKKRAPVKRKSKIIAARKPSRLRAEVSESTFNTKARINNIKKAEPKKTTIKTKRQAAHLKQSKITRSESPKGLSTLKWMICGILAGCLLGGLGYFYFLSPSDAPTSQSVKTSSIAMGQNKEVSVSLNQSFTAPTSAVTKQAKTNLSKNKEIKPSSKKPAVLKFEFYTILPKQEVWSPPKQDTEAVAAKKEKNNQKNQYVLQLASFRNSKDATQLLQRLEKLKLHPYLSTVKLQSGQQWSRIMLGPFASKRDAEKVRRVLQDANIQPGLLKLQQNS